MDLLAHLPALQVVVPLIGAPICALLTAPRCSKVRDTAPSDPPRSTFRQIACVSGPGPEN